LTANESLVRSPRLNDRDEARLRALALAYRGWPSMYLFQGFPREVAWTRVLYTRRELALVRFPALEEWHRRSPTRFPEPAAAGLRSGALAEPDTRQACRLLAERYRLGSRIPPIIVVAPTETGPAVVLEGCLRLTAMFWGTQPEEAEALLGISPVMKSWPLYGSPAGIGP